jgi:diguanylate cyclase (GGDEF)-like protein
MARDPKNITAALFGGTLAASLLMALAGVIVLFSGRDIGTPLKAVAGVLICFSPVPVASTAFLARLADRYRQEVKSSTTRDALTGLYNQHTFWDLLQYETQRSKRQQYKFTLLYMDVDNFKVINDKYGHEVGDLYLKDLANILKTAVRRGDIPARYSGDNFAAILPLCDEEQAYLVAKRIMDSLRVHTLVLPDGSQVQETVSIGVAVYPSHAEDAQDLFLIADSMLGQAKSSGKDHVAFPSERDNIEMLRNLGEKNILILDALRGQKHRRIIPYFQPIIDVKTRAVLAHEVLTRIQVDGDIIPASDFIEAAENMGAIGKIDYLLIEQTFKLVREKRYPGTLFLNLSPKALIIGDFLPTVRSLLLEYGINPGNMVFEITERDTVKNIRLIEEFVRGLRKEGFRFAIDDFGSGYSSLQYLRSFPVDYLKLDGEFITSLPADGNVVKSIVSSIADLANRLGIKTIAEYVESEQILREVVATGVHYAQGYYIKRPSPELA